jgi:hypothetical protein
MKLYTTYKIQKWSWPTPRICGSQETDLLIKLTTHAQSLSWWETSITIVYHTVLVTIQNSPTAHRFSQHWIVKIWILFKHCIETSAMNSLSCKFPGQISRTEYLNFVNLTFVLLITLHPVYLLVHPSVVPGHKGTMQPLLLLCRAPVKKYSISKSLLRRMTLQCFRRKHFLVINSPIKKRWIHNSHS